jgi:hypothetical protein
MMENQKFCPHCGFHLGAAAAFCGSCGVRLSVDPPEEESDDEIGEKEYQREQAEIARLAQGTLPPLTWQELHPQNRGSLRSRWFRSIVASILQAAVALLILALIVVMLTSSQVTGKSLFAFILFALILGVVGFIFGRGCAANLRAVGLISRDLAENRKEIVLGYVAAIWEEEKDPDSNRPRGPISQLRAPKHNRCHVELKKGGDGTTEEFEVPYKLYRQFNRRDRVQAEIACHSRVLLQLVKV